MVYLKTILPSSIITSPSIDVLLSRKGPLRIQLGDRILTVINPALSAFFKLEELLQTKPDLKESFAIASSAMIREAVWQVNEKERVEAVVRELHDTKPNMSAKALLTNWQCFFLGILIFGTCLLIYFQPNNIILILHASFSLFYLSFNLLKLSAGFFFYAEADPDKLPTRPELLPKYTILIALYKEEQVAQQLIKAMSRLKWPKSKLDIKLICEDEDISTITALIDVNPGPQFEIIRVPYLRPKTKPKALQYAMVAAKGEFVAVYDAEDRPHPDQLLEAYREFERHGEYLACLQAPLVMTNADRGWLPGLFSLEYSSLFRRLIPLLSHFGLPIPLGGTSNHFRKSALLEVGGWDPCNVTEDVDLGIRLYKQGYYTGLLKRPTLETAPTKINVWIKQRTRWLKGWMQTWLVFMRHPLQQLANGGIFSFIIMQILIGGLLIASLAHPFVIFFIALTINEILSNTFFEASILEICLFYLDIFNIVAGYLIFVRVGMSSLISAQKKMIKKHWLFFTPLYWLLMSVAGWRALSQLPLRSQFWEKTPHEPARREL
ncbi:MAG: glycosyltransferase family 2 protein [Lentilitoribacter sp.]